MKYILLFLLAVTSFAPATFAGQGVELEMEVKEGEKTDITKMVVLDNHLKMEILTDSSGKDFMTFDGKKMCTIDNSRSECSCMTKEDIEKIAAQLNEQFAQFDMDEMLKDVPDAQKEMVRKQMEKMMPQKPAPQQISKPDLKKLGNENYNNYPSSKYLLKSDDEENYLWVTDWSNISGGKDISNAFTNLGKFFDEMIQAMSQLPGANQREDNNFMRIMDDVNGVIHSSKAYENGNLKRESRLKKSYKREVNMSEFESPYTCKNPLAAQQG